MLFLFGGDPVTFYSTIWFYKKHMNKFVKFFHEEITSVLSKDLSIRDVREISLYICMLIGFIYAAKLLLSPFINADFMIFS